MNITEKLSEVIKTIDGVESLELDNDWFTFEFKDKFFQMGLREPQWFQSQHYEWEDKEKERIYIGVSLGEVSYDFDFDEVFKAIKKANLSLSEHVRLSEADNYFILMRWLEADEAELLPQALSEIQEGINNQTLLDVVYKYKASGKYGKNTETNCLECTGVINRSIGHISDTAFNGSSLFLLDSDKVYSIDAESRKEAYTIELSGSSSHSKITISDDYFIINRYKENRYTLTSYASKDGEIIWETSLPVEIDSYCESFLSIIKDCLIVIIETDSYILDASSGKLIMEKSLPVSEGSGLFCDQVFKTVTGKDYVFMEYRNKVERMDADGNIEPVVSNSVDSMTCSENSFFYIDRESNKIAVVDIESLKCSDTFEVFKVAKRKFGKAHEIASVPGHNELLLIRGDYEDVCCLVDTVKKEIIWNLQFNTEYDRPDGFRPGSVAQGENIILAELYSAGSGTSFTRICDTYTGQGLADIDSGHDGQVLIRDRFVLHRTSGELRILEKCSGDSELSDYMFLAK